MKIKLCLILILLISQSSFAFDSEREGFIISAGLGFAPSASTQISDFPSSRVKTNGFALSLMAGYGYNENTMLLFMLEGLQSKDSTFISPVETTRQGFMGAGIRFYFNEIGQSVFITSCLGIQKYMKTDSNEELHEAGLGYLVGFGYEFAESFQVQATLSSGQTKNSFPWDHSQFILTASIILY